MAEVLKKFGRYFLLDLMAQGGMAEIYRARLASPDGAGRLLVIKRIQAGFDSNSEFIQMFRSEIKVTMGFNHPNIVQLYDFGEEGGQLYIAMEFVDGKNLRQFISRFAELKQPFPVELATYVVEQAACGLHYAHSFRDKISGQPLHVVHRDISPQNLLISYEGTVKVIDFGIAKASNNVENTRAGVIKGKPSYLSPEQISGEALDGRSDVFSLGAVFWEILTGKKLFAGENDLAVLKMIESCQSHVKPPSTLNPKIPKELDYIVLKALAKSREKRFQSAEEFQRALHKFLYAYMPEFNPSDLGYYAKDMYKNEIVEDRKKIQKLNDEVERLLANSQIIFSPAKNFQEKSASISIKEDTTTVVGGRASRNDVIELSSTGGKEAGLELDPKSLSDDIPSPPKYRSQSRSSPTGLRPSAPEPVFGSQSRPSVPSQRSSGSPASRYATPALVGVAALLALVVLGPSFGVRVPVASDIFDSMLGGNETRLQLQGSEKNVTVLVNGQIVADSLPTSLKGIPIGTPFHLSVAGSNGIFEQDIVVRRGEKKIVAVSFVKRDTASVAPPPSPLTRPADQPAEQALPKGMILLKLNITPGGGRTLSSLGGKTVSGDNPVFPVQLDAPLELAVERQGFKTFRREFVLGARQVEGLKEYLMEVPLEPMQFGFITLHTTPSADATIMMGGKPWIKKTPIEREKLPIGTYTIRLSNEVLGMEKILTVTIQEGKLITLDERLLIKD